MIMMIITGGRRAGGAGQSASGCGELGPGLRPGWLPRSLHPGQQLHPLDTGKHKQGQAVLRIAYRGTHTQTKSDHRDYLYVIHLIHISRVERPWILWTYPLIFWFTSWDWRGIADGLCSELALTSDAARQPSPGKVSELFDHFLKTLETSSWLWSTSHPDPDAAPDTSSWSWNTLRLDVTSSSPWSRAPRSLETRGSRSFSWRSRHSPSLPAWRETRRPCRQQSCSETSQGWWRLTVENYMDVKVFRNIDVISSDKNVAIRGNT